MFFLIHTTTVWSPTFMSTGIISINFWQVLAWLYGPNQKYVEAMEPTKTSTTPTNTPNLLQSLYVLPNTYYYSMKSNFYVYRYDIYLFLAITCLIIWIKPEIWGSNGTNQDQYRRYQTRTMLKSLYVFSNLCTVWNLTFMSTGIVSIYFWPLLA
jgi:hypothetical protein